MRSAAHIGIEKEYGTRRTERRHEYHDHEDANNSVHHHPRILDELHVASFRGDRNVAAEAHACGFGTG